MGRKEQEIDQTKGNVRLMVTAGILFGCLELLKQWYLVTAVFPDRYPVWYVPFQLCSMPIYLGLLYPFFPERLKRAAETFLVDFGLLGGAAALIVRDGFTFPEHPALTLHGWVWHLLMCALAIILWLRQTPGQSSPRGFAGTLPLLAVLALIAEGINVILHPFGDCDMFYISPYHLSSQPFFHDVDVVIGRPLGILFYLFAVILGAAIIHGAGMMIHYLCGNRPGQQAWPDE